MFNFEPQRHHCLIILKGACGRLALLSPETQGRKCKVQQKQNLCLLFSAILGCEKLLGFYCSLLFTFPAGLGITLICEVRKGSAFCSSLFDFVVLLVFSLDFPTCEPLTQFGCINGKCISVKWHCDSGELKLVKI